jgi:protein-ribulosamine 3-kinase
VTLPADVRAGVEAALEARTGRASPIDRVSPVGGGCISPTARFTTAAGESFFLKRGGPGLPAGMLEAEARGLEALAAAEAVRVPEVIGTGGSGPDGWLLLEWLPPGGVQATTWERLGRDLARLHRRRARRFGADRDNFIGSLAQSNAPVDSWPDFWRDHRLEPQLRLARDRGLLGAGEARRFDAVFANLDTALEAAADDGASLLHGDLWSGNVHILEDGTPAVVDPSVYHGHREVDLAMAQLFGGFDAAFRSAYLEAWPLEPGYEPTRRAIYQLYYLLVHVNLFGPSYLAGTRAALAEAGT